MKTHRQSYEQIRSEKTLIAVTGLKRKAFEELCEKFGACWQAHIAEYRLDGSPRQRRLGRKRADILPSDADKLFFILKYLKNNPLQEELAHDFAMPQPHANLWIHALLPVIRQTLKAMSLSPQRTSENLSEILDRYEYVLLDGTERRIERPQDAEEQKAVYSGKKKSPTAKNIVITAPDKRILFASTTAEGSAHDKTLTDDAGLLLSAPVVVLADSGFQGLSLGEAAILLPCKKPRGKARPEHHRRWNRVLARARVTVENALANAKTFRIVKDVIRLKTAELRDTVFEIACGLANLRLNH